MKYIAVLLALAIVCQGNFLQKGFISDTKDIIGEAYNNEEKQDVGAVTYALASNAGHSLTDDEASGYVAPQMVEKLPNQISAPKPGPLEAADEVATDVQYYDGSTRLNSVTIDCAALTAEPQNCCQQESCGWCGSTNACISGTATGPEAACEKKSFVFTAPSAQWNPLVVAVPKEKKLPEVQIVDDGAVVGDSDGGLESMAQQVIVEQN